MSLRINSISLMNGAGMKRLKKGRLNFNVKLSSVCKAHGKINRRLSHVCLSALFCGSHGKHKHNCAKTKT